MSTQGTVPQEKVAVFWHEGMLEKHDLGLGAFDTLLDPGFLDVLEPHPENSARLRNMISILRRGPLAPHVSWHSPGRFATPSELLSFHSPGYIQQLIKLDAQGANKELCTGTKLVAGSWDAARLAAGTTLDAMKSILEGQTKLAYALVRPPGHHAQPTRADGYCFLSNAGLAVQLAIASGIKRVAVLDIDAHYGNGTAEGFYDRDDVLTISMHMHHGSWGPSHPQSGLPAEVGKGRGAGFNMNIPLPNGSGDKCYEYAMHELVNPVISKFKPEIMLLLVGQDSSAFDPNGRLSLTMAGFRRVAHMVRELANQHSSGRLLVVQEGGYQVTYSAYCLHATLEGALQLPPLLSDPFAYYPEDERSGVAAIAQVKKDWIQACLNVMPQST